MEKANKLYLFSPKNWPYCGGAVIICAPNLKAAIVLGNGLKNSKAPDGGEVSLIPETDPTDPGFSKSGAGGSGCWVFVDEFILAKPMPVGLVFADANYA